ncbi:type II secretion system F family protein [Actinomyces bowdenii]|uniref:type II secretion system F family protein n=1 Tax=Actinomyces bowdenii TaxID=131109 RepID=UPI001FBA4A81|nr:type II secretion system F family protein [Actinomyces bowdenii]
MSPWLVLFSAVVPLVLGCWGIAVLSGDRARSQELEESVGAGGRPANGGRLGGMGRRLRSTRWMTGMQKRLAAAGLSWPAGRVLLVLAFAIIVILLGGQVLVGRIASVVIALLLPLLLWKWLDYRKTKRTQRFVAQLPELARLLANGSSAGLSMRRCLGMAATELPEPASGEINHVVSQLDIGWSIEQALQQLTERLPSREVGVLIRTIVIQQRAGGELVRALHDIAASLEDRKELRREVGTTIMGASISGYAVILIGLGSVLLMNLLKPGILDMMATSLLGQIALVTSGVLFGGGIGLMRLVGRVDI